MSKSCEGDLVWVGAETGLLKAVDLKEKSATNYRQTEEEEADDKTNVVDRGIEHRKRNEIVAMCWASEQSEIYTALRCGVVNIFSVADKQYSSSHQCTDTEGGVFVGIAKSENSLVTCTDGGSLTVWNDEWKKNCVINAGKEVCRMRLNKSKLNLAVTGGKENELKIWDITKPDVPLFKSKNVTNDFLNLRVPVWFTDMSFMSDSQKVVACTRYHQVRVYDPNTPQRRPVLDFNCGESPLTALTLLPDNRSVIVGDSKGRMVQIDLRKGQEVKVFKGFAGGIRSIEYHPDRHWVASCGLDRFLRVHSLTPNSFLHKVYLKSRLNCLLLSHKPENLVTGSVGNLPEISTEKCEENELINENEIKTLSSDKSSIVESTDNEISTIKTNLNSNTKTKRRRKKKSTTSIGESATQKSIKLNN